MLEVLKLFLDCDRCVFVLAVDYEVVTLGIKQKFGNDVSKEKGRSFFDKIIQLPFKVPVANYDIHKYVRDMMQQISEYTIGVNVFISLRNGKGMEVGFFRALGDNPLRLAIIPQREDWGRYRYNNLLRLNANDQSAADQIASLVSNSLASLKETLDEYRNTHEGLNNI